MALPSLLLLTPQPTPCDKSRLKAAYQKPIKAALIQLASLHLQPLASLDILVPLPSHLDSSAPRSALFAEVQHLLAGLYSLVSLIAAKEKIELDGPGGIDARILLLHQSGAQRDGPAATGPIIGTHTFAQSRREWKVIFTIDSEAGAQIAASYRSAVKGTTHKDVVGEWRAIASGTTLSSPSISKSISMQSQSGSAKWEGKEHHVVAVGGTFDHLHTGHKLLLTCTALILQPSESTPGNTPRRLIIGITGDDLLINKKFASELESWEQREQNVVNFLIPILSFSSNPTSDIERTVINEDRVNGQGVLTELKRANLTIECVKIQDPFGPTITDEAVTALVVSGETRDGGKAVNDKRKEKGWAGLQTFEIDVLDAEDDEVEGASKTENFAAKISSTVIRQRRAEGAKEGRRPSPSL